MSEKQHIDQLIRDKVQDHQYEFKDEYWNEMERMLDQQGSTPVGNFTSSGLKTLILSSVMLTVGLVGGYMLKDKFVSQDDIAQNPVEAIDNNNLTNQEVDAVSQSSSAYTNTDNSIQLTTVDNNNQSTTILPEPTDKRKSLSHTSVETEVYDTNFDNTPFIEFYQQKVSLNDVDHTSEKTSIENTELISADNFKKKEQEKEAEVIVDKKDKDQKKKVWIVRAIQKLFGKE